MHVQRHPEWADAPIDAARLLFDMRLTDRDSAMIDAGMVEGGAGVRIRFAEGATFWISSGLDEIWLEYSTPLTARDASYFLFEPVLAFVLRRRGTLALHASAVEIGGRAVLLCGAAGSGKSTAAAALSAAGHRVLSDDIVALTEHAGGWRAHCGPSAIRVWDEGARALGYDSTTLPRFSSTWEKRTLPPTGSPGDARAAPLALICVLGEREGAGSAPRLERISGALAIRELLPNTAANLLHDAARRATELTQLARLVRDVPITRLTAHADPRRLPDLASAVIAALHG